MLRLRRGSAQPQEPDPRRVHLGRDMQDQPAEAALFANLLDPHYVRILCGTLDELPHAFAQLVQSGAATVRPDLDRGSRDSYLRSRIRQWKL